MTASDVYNTSNLLVVTSWSPPHKPHRTTRPALLRATPNPLRLLPSCPPTGSTGAAVVLRCLFAAANFTLFHVSLSSIIVAVDCRLSVVDRCRCRCRVRIVPRPMCGCPLAVSSTLFSSSCPMGITTYPLPVSPLPCNCVHPRTHCYRLDPSHTCSAPAYAGE